MNEKRKLLIIGASGHGKVVADIAVNMEIWSTIEFLDDDTSIREIMGFKVIGPSNIADSLINEYDMFVAIGNNITRARLQKRLTQSGARFATLIHRNAIVGMDVTVGNGTVIMGGCVINPSTKIGDGCIINTGSTIDHDNNIEEYVHISPGVHLAGTVSVGKSTWLGIGSSVINNIEIASEVIIGAGSVVVKNINQPGTYIGIPAKQV